MPSGIPGQHSTGSAHEALRVATAECHRRVDAVFGRFELDDEVSYTQFLGAHAAALIPIELALDAGAFPRLLADWPQRRRGAALQADLRALRVETGPAVDGVRLDSDAACWGAAYVLEGSRLGGRVLSRRLPERAPRAYLDAPCSDWRGFLLALDAALRTDGDRARAIAAAEATFARFETAGRSMLEDAAHV